APGTGRVNQNTDRTEGRRSGVWALPGVATGLPSEIASGCVRELQWQALSALCPLTADLLSGKRAAVLRLDGTDTGRELAAGQRRIGHHHALDALRGRVEITDVFALVGAFETHHDGKLDLLAVLRIGGRH